MTSKFELLTVGLTFDTSHTICVFFATCLHYFYLVVAFWMNVLHFDLCRVCFKRCLLHKGQVFPRSILFSSFFNLNFWRFCFDFKNVGRRTARWERSSQFQNKNKSKQSFKIFFKKSSRKWNWFYFQKVSTPTRELVRAKWRFKIYSYYAWGIPILIVSAGHLSGYFGPLQDYSPDYASHYCWINRKAGLALYFALPLAASWLENAIFIGITVICLLREQKGSQAAYFQSK